MKKLLSIAILMCAAVVVVNAQAPRLTTPREDRYTLNPGDVIELQYRYTPEFNQTVTVQPDGYVSLEIGGDLKVAGRNLTQVRALILSKAGERLASPELNVILKEFQKPYVVVSGEVAQPGRIEVREKLTALQAVLLAGGFKDSAKSSQVLVFRKLNADMAEVKTLNFKSMNRSSDLENDMTLQAGDMILVPRNKLSKVERYVRIASLAGFINPLIR